ncbi:hypothetical protein [Sporisorium scitamineum]|nr:hypothetical protein [Sporisorium scitamineum]
MVLSKLRHLDPSVEVEKHELSQVLQTPAAKEVHQVLDAQRHVQNLIHIHSTSRNSHTYAFVLRFEGETRTVRKQTDPTVATLALITVHRVPTNRIELNGFVNAKDIGNRPILLQRILSAGGPSEEDQPISHDLDSLLGDRIAGFRLAL